MISETDIAYIAGLFDGEGCIQYKQYMRRRRPCEKYYATWSIRMEVSMTDESTIRYIHEVLGVGTVGPRKNGKGSLAKKKQWRWRCGFRDAYYVARLFWPYSHTKLDKIQKIIDHYGDSKLMSGKVIDLKKYKEAMSLE